MYYNKYLANCGSKIITTKLLNYLIKRPFDEIVKISAKMAFFLYYFAILKNNVLFIHEQSFS